MGGFQFGVGDFGGGGVGFQSSVLYLFMSFTSGVFRDISIVISFHFQVKDLGFRVVGFGDEVGVE